MGGNYRTSWGQVFSRRLKAANAEVNGVNPSRSDVVPLVAADRPDLYDMFRDAAGVFKAPSFGHPNYLLAVSPDPRGPAAPGGAAFPSALIAPAAFLKMVQM